MRGYTMKRSDYLNRLRQIEGQIRGLQRMIEGRASPSAWSTSISVTA